MTKEETTVERIDHLGIIAGVIQDLNLTEEIDKRIAADPREEITVGEAVAAMIINGLGFSDRPLSLTPQFFENKALEKFFHKPILPSYFNRFKLGRALDDCHEYGCDTLFTQLSWAVCKKEGIDTRFNGLDTTTFSLTGEYEKDCDEHTIAITHGYSKDHRPDLKQAVLELICTHDGGVPVISKSWDGNASDTRIFRERAKALMKQFKKGEGPLYLIADSKLYDQKTINGLTEFPFITRIPRTIKQERICIDDALQMPFIQWEAIDKQSAFLCFNIAHYGINQRWMVVYSAEAQARASAKVEKKCQKEKEELDKELKKLNAQGYSCREDAEKVLKKFGKKSRFHDFVEQKIREKKKYLSKGRPSEKSSFKFYYYIEGTILLNIEKKNRAIREGSCFVVGTNITDKELSAKEVILAYKKQNNSVEKGFRFLKDPYFFTSSLFVKKPSRIMGLLMVMILALLVYSIAQRRLRLAL